MRVLNFRKCFKWHTGRRTTVSQRDWMNKMSAIKDAPDTKRLLDSPRCFEVANQTKKSRRFFMSKVFLTARTKVQPAGIKMINFGPVGHPLYTGPAAGAEPYIYIYIYIHIYTCIIHVYIYIYIERERGIMQTHTLYIYIYIYILSLSLSKCSPSLALDHYTGTWSLSPHAMHRPVERTLPPKGHRQHT